MYLTSLPPLTRRQEWYKTMGDLPLILRQAAQMGLFSSAALVRFMSMDVRPSVTRFVTRTLPPAASRQVSAIAPPAGPNWRPGPAILPAAAGLHTGHPGRCPPPLPTTPCRRLWAG